MGNWEDRERILRQGGEGVYLTPPFPIDCPICQRTLCHPSLYPTTHPYCDPRPNVRNLSPLHDCRCVHGCGERSRDRSHRCSDPLAPCLLLRRRPQKPLSLAKAVGPSWFGGSHPQYWMTKPPPRQLDASFPLSRPVHQICRSRDGMRATSCG